MRRSVVSLEPIDQRENIDAAKAIAMTVLKSLGDSPMGRNSQ